MRDTLPEMKLAILAALLLIPAAGAVDLARARIVAPPSATARESRAIRHLVEEVAVRTQLRLPVAQSGQDPSIRIGNARTGPPEGYTLETSAAGVRITGNDERGVLFGIGHLLRILRMTRGAIDVPTGLRVSTAPKMALRGHQLGFRPKTNSYDGWTIAIWEQYIADLAVFGTNAIELIPPRSDDDADSPHFPQPPMDTMVAMSRIADEFGLDVWIWYPAMDEDYSKPATVDSALKEWAEVFRRLPRVDAVFVPGGDPGHTHPKYLLPMLEKQAASLRQFHPKAQMWMAPQGFNGNWFNEFLLLLRQEPAWLNGIVHGPQLRMSLPELRKIVPKRYPIRNYPDITHSLRCQFPVLDWDPAFQLTLHREPINPRPLDMKQIFDLAANDSAGFITYSEGCNDDVNKFVWSALGWNPQADLHETLREYSRYFIGDRLAASFAAGLFALERNWRGPVLSNPGIDTTLAQFEAMDREADPFVMRSWRFQQAQYRAHYDAYIRARLLHETNLEREAMDHLREAGRTGSFLAMDQAERALDRAAVLPAPQWRARAAELAEALFQSIRMQLSVPFYKAIAVGRGANLDLIDTPLNSRGWIKSRFAEIRTRAAEPERLAGIRQILDWTNPGPGGYYDDLGNVAAQPHLVRPPVDPESRNSPLMSTASATDGTTRSWRTSWIDTADALFDAPIEMHYRHLDPAARYKVRYVYGSENFDAEIRLLANGREIRPPMKKPASPRVIEDEIPAEVTSGGELRLRWERTPGAGGNGRGLQIAEVWLLRVEPKR